MLFITNRPHPANKDMATKYKAGDKVQVKWNGQWYNAAVEAVDTQYKVTYTEDGTYDWVDEKSMKDRKYTQFRMQIEKWKAKKMKPRLFLGPHFQLFWALTLPCC